MQFSVGEQLSGTAYRFIEAVGSGGMGSVYEVEHAELGKRFVLKILHHHLAARSDLVARMRNEWRALAKLNHPNIVQVTDAGQLPNGLPFYVMEKLEGCNLGQLIGKEGRLRPERAGVLIAHVLDGLDAAHSTGAVHRDVKPQNIFIVGGERAKLLDFGIAKLRDRAARVVTAGGVSIGTPRYMAPEQAEGRAVDGRADIYAAGLVLYECIAGKGPFSNIRDPNELVLAHIGMDPLRLDMVVHGLSPEWADLVQRWLSKLPADRPANAGMAAAELRALIAASPVGATESSQDVTRGGIYDAETVGADELGDDAAGPGGRWTAAMRRRTNQPVASRVTRGSHDGMGNSVARGEHAIRNGDAIVQAAPENLQEVKKTLGWGTRSNEGAAAPVLTETQSLSPGRSSSRLALSRSPRSEPRVSKSASGSRGLLQSPLRFQTPPPVSTRPTRMAERNWWSSLSPTQKSIVTVLGAAVGSFVIAWIALQAGSLIKADMNRNRLSNPPVQAAAKGNEPARADQTGSTVVETSKHDTPVTAAESQQSHEEVQSPSHDSSRPQGSPESQGSAATQGSAKATSSGKVQSSTTASKTSQSVTTGPQPVSTGPQSVKAATKTTPPRSAEPPEKKASKIVDLNVRKAPAPAPSLPGSGLW